MGPLRALLSPLVMSLLASADQCIAMHTIPAPEPPLSPSQPGVRYLARIKGVGHPSSNLVEEPRLGCLTASRLHHALLTACQRMELASLRPWDGSREHLLALVASAAWCSDATLVQDEPAYPMEPTLLGWTATFEVTVTDLRITSGLLGSLLAWAGLVNALEDWHPAYGRFAVESIVTVSEAGQPPPLGPKA